jgi:hypothetical protein
MDQARLSYNGKKAGPLSKWIAFGYALPTQEAHATVKAILDRLSIDESGIVQFNREPDVNKITRSCTRRTL